MELMVLPFLGAVYLFYFALSWQNINFINWE